MTTVVAVLDHVARMVSVTPPSDWTAATNTVHVQLRDDILRATVEDIQDRIDIGAPIGKQVTITGTGAAAYDLPGDFKRLTEDDWRVYEPTMQRRKCVPVSNDGFWSHLEEQGTTGNNRYYRINGYDENYQIELKRALATGDRVIVSYIADVWCKSAAGVEQDTLAGVADVLLLPRRVVEVGMQYRYLHRHGMPYQGEYGEYEALLTRLGKTTKSRQIIGSGGGSASSYQYPEPPDFIPAGP